MENSAYFTLPVNGDGKPHVTQDFIDEIVVDSSIAYQYVGRSVICTITLPNGFCVVGEAHAQPATHYVKSVGEDSAYKAAVNKLWEYFIFLCYLFN